MQDNILNNKTCVHFIGIGGVSMSGLALIVKSFGIRVTGSDICHTNIINKLEDSGIEVSIGHRADNIDPDCDLIVYTAAISPDNPEMLHAKEKSILLLERPVLLGLIMKNYENAICISGTHGKTTTTSMLAVVLDAYGLDPTITVGGELTQIGGNLKIGQNNKYFICEACEYVDSFLKFYPTAAIITNIEEDHLDYFSGINDIITSFHKFASMIPENGAICINYDDENVKKAACNISCRVIKYSIYDKTADFFVQNVLMSSDGKTFFDLYKNKKCVFRAELSVTGIHNVYNALSCLCLCDSLGLDIIKCGGLLTEFTGTKRRFEYKGQTGGIKIYDDYAHHPTELKTTIETAHRLCGKNAWFIFQPHTYTRTKLLFNDFAEVLSKADKLIITDIYAAREKDTGEVSSKMLADKIKGAVYIKDFDEIAEHLRQNAKNGEIIITVGAGDVFKICDLLL